MVFMAISTACLMAKLSSRQCLKMRVANEANPLNADLWVRERIACGPPSLTKMEANSWFLVRRRQSLKLEWSVSGSRLEERR